MNLRTTQQQNRRALPWVADLTTALLLFACSFPSLALASGAVTQDQAYRTTDLTNRQGSDNSLQSSTVFAMTALMDLGNLNIPSAVNNGMTAYGKYRNSETMDRLGDQNLLRASALSSIGAGESAAPSQTPTNTTFRRLDPSFLRKGKAGEVAAEFEKRSGMKRETFLSHLSDVSEKKIKRSDPQLVDKVVGRFENFVSQIPNPDFRANLQKGVNMVPDSVRTGVISKAVAKFATLSAGHGSSSVSAATPGAPPSTPATGSPAGGGGTAGNSSLAEVRAPASAGSSSPLVEAGTAPGPATPYFRVDDDRPGNDPERLGNIVQAAIDTQGQDATIFQIVSKRYRLVTPSLSPPALQQ